MSDLIKKLPNELIMYINNFLQRTDQLALKLTNKHYYLTNKITHSLDEELKLYTKTICQMDYSWKNSNYIEIKDWSFNSEYSITNYYGFIYGLWWFDFITEFSIDKCDYTILIITSFNNFNSTLTMFDKSNEVIDRKEFANVNKFEYKSNCKGILRVNCYEHNRGKYYHNFQFIMCIPTHYYAHTVKSHKINFNIPTYYDCVRYCYTNKKTYYPYYSSNNCVECVCFLIENNEFSMVKYLISSGIVNLNSIADNEYNFFDVAFLYKKYYIMCYLYFLDININNLNENYEIYTNNQAIANKDKLSLLILNKSGLYNDLLDFACANNDIEFVKYLFLNEKITQTNMQINPFDKLDEPNYLIWTIVLDHLDIFIYLIELFCIENFKFKNSLDLIKKISFESKSFKILNYLNQHF